MATQPAPRSYQAWTVQDTAPDTFNLDAGKYGLTVAAGVWGTATLNRILPDGSGGTVLVPMTAALAANGYTVIELPAGKYILTIAGITGLTGRLEQIAPGRMGG